MAVLAHIAVLARGSTGMQQWFSDTQATFTAVTPQCWQYQPPIQGGLPP